MAERRWEILEPMIRACLAGTFKQTEAEARETLREVMDELEGTRAELEEARASYRLAVGRYDRDVPAAEERAEKAKRKAERLRYGNAKLAEAVVQLKAQRDRLTTQAEAHRCPAAMDRRESLAGLPMGVPYESHLRAALSSSPAPSASAEDLDLIRATANEQRRNRLARQREEGSPAPEPGRVFDYERFACVVLDARSKQRRTGESDAMLARWISERMRGLAALDGGKEVRDG